LDISGYEVPSYMDFMDIWTTMEELVGERLM
jgi:hypothetical protein